MVSRTPDPDLTDVGEPYQGGTPFWSAIIRWTFVPALLFCLWAEWYTPG